MGWRQVRNIAGAVSVGFLREGHGRPHRRSEWRLEGQGRVDHLGDAHALPCRGREGEPAESRALPAPPRPAGGLTESERGRQFLPRLKTPHRVAGEARFAPPGSGSFEALPIQIESKIYGSDDPI